MEITDTHILKTVAMLLAMQHYQGEKRDGLSFIHSAMAVDQLNHFFLLGDEAASDADPTRQALARRAQMSTIVAAAKLLGLYQDEPAGFPTTEWLAERDEEFDKGSWGEWWKGFSAN